MTTHTAFHRPWAILLQAMSRAQGFLRSFPPRSHPLPSLLFEFIPRRLGHPDRNGLLLRGEPFHGEAHELRHRHPGIEIWAPAGLAVVEVRWVKGRRLARMVLRTGRVGG